MKDMVEGIEKPKETLKKLQKKKLQYTIMIYIIASFEGGRWITGNVNLWYVKSVLDGTPQQYTSFVSWTTIFYSLKPLTSFITEVFFPFKYRIKFYVSLYAFLVLIGAIIVCVARPGYNLFFLCVFLQNVGYSSIGGLGEGLTAELLKVEKRISLISSTLNPEYNSQINSKKSIGNFYNFRMIMSNVTLFYGSFVQYFGSLVPFYGTQLIISFLLIIYTIFIFEEERKVKMYTGVKNPLLDM